MCHLTGLVGDEIANNMAVGLVRWNPLQHEVSCSDDGDWQRLWRTRHCTHTHTQPVSSTAAADL